MDKRVAVIFDLDNTLFDTSHRQIHLADKVDGKWVAKKKPDWASWEREIVNDVPNPAVAFLYRMFTSDYDDIVVICLTGRKEFEREATLEQFNKFYLSNPDHLFMRSDNDHRPDTVYKTEVYRNEIEPNYEILFVLEDRSRVVNMWRDLGLTCFQVIDGDY